METDTRGLCRAKVLWNGNHYFSGDWVYGYLSKTAEGKVLITDLTDTGYGHIPYILVEVDPETVGMFAGIYMPEETKIFEGDKCKYTYYIMADQKSDSNRKLFGGEGIIVFKDGCFRVESKELNHFIPLFHKELSFEITGTIHDKDKNL